MTDARFPERWLNDRRLLRLPDDAFRLFTTSLMWSVANKTDGVLYDDDLPLIPGADPGCHGHLAKAGLWKREWDRWIIPEFEETQTTRADLEVLARGRRAQRDKKRRQRAAKAGRAAAVPGDVPRDTPRTGQDRTGQAPRNVVPGNASAADDLQKAPEGAKRLRAAEGGTTPSPDGVQATNSVALASEHNGPDNRGADVQHFSIEVHRQSQATDRNAREDRGTPPRRWPESKTRRQEITRLGAEGLTYREIAAKTGKSVATISGILRRRTAAP